MAASIAQLGYGTTLSFGSLNLEITSFGGSESKDRIDATHMDSDDRRKEYIAGLKDSGELTVECHLSPQESSPMDEADDQVCRVTFPDSYYFEWAICQVTGFEWTAPVADKMTATVTISLGGAFSQGS